MLLSPLARHKNCTRPMDVLPTMVPVVPSLFLTEELHPAHRDGHGTALSEVLPMPSLIVTFRTENVGHVVAAMPIGLVARDAPVLRVLRTARIRPSMRPTLVRGRVPFVSRASDLVTGRVRRIAHLRLRPAVIAIPVRPCVPVNELTETRCIRLQRIADSDWFLCDRHQVSPSAPEMSSEMLRAQWSPECPELPMHCLSVAER